MLIDIFCGLLNLLGLLDPRIDTVTAHHGLLPPAMFRRLCLSSHLIVGQKICLGFDVQEYTFFN